MKKITALLSILLMNSARAWHFSYIPLISAIAGKKSTGLNITPQHQRVPNVPLPAYLKPVCEQSAREKAELFVQRKKALLLERINDSNRQKRIYIKNARWINKNLIFYRFGKIFSKTGYHVSTYQKELQLDDKTLIFDASITLQRFEAKGSSSERVEVLAGAEVWLTTINFPNQIPPKTPSLK